MFECAACAAGGVFQGGRPITGAQETHGACRSCILQAGTTWNNTLAFQALVAAQMLLDGPLAHACVCLLLAGQSTMGVSDANCGRRGCLLQAAYTCAELVVCPLQAADTTTLTPPSTRAGMLQVCVLAPHACAGMCSTGHCAEPAVLISFLQLCQTPSQTSRTPVAGAMKLAVRRCTSRTVSRPTVSLHTSPVRRLQVITTCSISLWHSTRTLVMLYLSWHLSCLHLQATAQDWTAAVCATTRPKPSQS